MNKRMQKLIALFSLVLLLASMILVPNEAEAASEFYGDYTDVDKIYDYGSCPAMQGLAVGSQLLYTVKIKTDDTLAVISMTDKDTGSTTTLYNADAGSYYFNYLNHANDMDVWGIDGYSNIFVATTLQGSNAIVRLKRSGSSLTKVASYRLTCDGEEICATAMAIKGVSNGMIHFITKWGMDLYTGSVSTSVSSATIEMKQLCSISKEKVYIKGEYLDLSTFVNQGMGYYDGVLYVPITGDDYWLERSVVMVFNLDGVIEGSTIYPSESLVFRVTSGTYSALFEIESCGVSSDGRLYFNTNRRKTDSDTNHDGVSYFDTYTFSKLTEPAKYHHYTVRYDANGGTGTMANTTVPYGVSTPLANNSFTKPGSKFVGWQAYRTTNDQWYYTNGTSTGWYKEGSQPSGYSKYIYKDGQKVSATSSVDGDVVIMYAQWETGGYNVTFKNDDGTVLQSSIVDVGAFPAAPANPTKAYDSSKHYSFKGWDKPLTSVTADTVYTATYTGTAHSYSTTVTQNATCSTPGTKTHACSCGYAYNETIPASGHKYDSTVTAPSCTSTGYITYTCATCGDSYTESTGVPGAHSYKAIVIEPTCTTGGYTTHRCSLCGDTYQSDHTPATGHSYNSVVTKPTCTAQGYTTYTCENCGSNYQGSYINAIGHSYNSVVTKPTCTVQGYTTYTCKTCGISYKDNVTSPTGHVYNTTTVNATCTTAGSVTKTCSGCGDRQVTTVPATGHSYANGSCTACGAADPNYNPGVTKPTLKLKAPTLEFKDMITVNAFFTAENIQDVVEMGMITYSYKSSVVSVETAEHKIPGATYIESSGRYLATSQGIHAKYLGDTVYLAVYAKLTDGTYVYTVLAPYSPVQYATSQLNNSTDTKLKQLCAAMLNYGAEAQLFFGHNTGSLANASLTAAQKALPESYRADMVAAVPAASAAKQGQFANNQGFAKRTPSISFEGAFCINYFFTPNYAPDNGITLYYWNAEDYNANSVLSTANATGKIKLVGSGTSQYSGVISGISAKDLSKAVYVCAAYKSGGTVWTSGVLGYSIGAYCSSQASKGAAVSNLAMATAVYGYHAKQYFG